MPSRWHSSAVSSRKLDSYDISDDLNRLHIQVLERRYGGRLRAHAAATRIQRAFRQYRLLQQWRSLVVPLRNDEQLVFNKRPYRRELRDYCSQGFVCSNVSNQLENSRLKSRGARRDCIAQSHCSRSLPQQHGYNHCSLSTSAINSRGKYIPAVNTNSRAIFLHQHNTAEARSKWLSERKQLPHSSSINPCDYVYPTNVSNRFVPEVMSPRLSFPKFAANLNESNTIWVPRSAYNTQHINATNSLPRFGTRIRNVPTGSCSYDRSLDDQKRRRQYRIALNFFNKKPSRGMQFLIDWRFVENDPLAIAKLLIGRRGLSKQMIGEFLGNLHDQYHSSVLEYFIEEIDLREMDIDVALRHTLTYFRLPGEAQKIERIMLAFSNRYKECNPERIQNFHSSDTVFILSFAMIMLNTDLHSPNIKLTRKMKLEEFIANLRGIDGGYDIDRALLTRIYGHIQEHQFQSGTDHISQVFKVDQSIIAKDKPKLVEPHRRLVCYCRLNQVLDCTKKQSSNAHQRDIFLFNDLMLVTKSIAKKKDSSQYSLKTWNSLMGMRISIFHSVDYPYGIMIKCSDERLLFFNAKNEDDRRRFVADVQESIAECAEMETIRIDYELDKHSLLSRTDSQRDSGLADIDTVSNNVSKKTAGTITNSARRLSFNSFDSGVIEELTDYYAN